MSLSLHAATVPSFLQILQAVRGLVEKAEAYCDEKGVPASDVLEARLAEDMFPFAYQVKSTAVHSLGAIEGLRNGVFSPDRSELATSFAGLTQKIDAAVSGLVALDPAELDGYAGRPMRFEMGQYIMDFTAEDFLLSFSQPNFYFHATTAYDILRWKGVALGKRDYMGAVRTKA